MAETFDYSTNRGKVRLLIADTDPANYLFNGQAIDAFIELARGSSVKRAAAIALRTIAANEILVQKRIRILDLSTDGPAEAVQLRQLADALDAQADEDDAADADGLFDTAEMILTPAQRRQYLFNEQLES
jgi:hypothetical protein